MNMISTGAFQTEMDASNKQQTLAEKFAAVWEKKNAKAARAGGVSLMALSLAACGSDDTTTTTTSTTTTTTTTTTPVNKTFVLTTNVDTGTAFTGGDGDDTFIADNTNGVTGETSSAADTLTGGAGADVLNIYSDGAIAGLPQMVGIETLNVYDEDAAFTVSAVDQSSVTTLNMIRGDGGTITTGANITTVNLSNLNVGGVAGTTNDVIIAFAATATSGTVGLDRVTHLNAATDENIDINGALLSTVNINATGTKSTVDVIDVEGAATINIDAAVNLTATGLTTSSTVATLNISGAGAVSLGVLDNGIDAVDGSGNSGGITLTSPADNSAAVITLGSGNDSFTTDDDGFTAAQTFAVDAGAGDADLLIVAAAADINTADEQGRYTNFETVRVSDTYDADQIAGITAIQLTGASSKSYTDLTATQAANVQIRGDETSPTIALKTATGTADVLSLTMGTGLTTAAASSIITGMTVTGFETLNIAENGGPTATAGANRTTTIAAFTGATLNDINLTGRAVTLGNIATTVAVDIDGSALTGSGAASGLQGLSVAGSAVAGSTITGSAVNDSFTAGAEGSTYNAGAGTDAFSATVALIAADGATDLVLDGGTGTDTLTLTNTTGVTLADTHFTNISNMEGLTLTNTGAGDTSITTGAAFNSAFSDGVTITSGIIAADQQIDVAAGLATVDMTITIAATSQTGAATELNSIVTGSGNDTITYTDTGWVGVAGAAQGTWVIDTNQGNDTISLTVGTLLGNATSTGGTGNIPIRIIGGSGQDSITKVGTNSNFARGVVHYEFAAGDSDTVNYDTITGFDLSQASNFSDGLDFEGTAAVASFTSHGDFGTIASHSVTAGLTTFDDAAGFATALVINSANLADVVGYLKLNMTANHTAAFTFDSTNNGTADGTMVFHQGSAASVADDLVFLAGVTADSVIATNASAGADDLFIL